MTEHRWLCAESDDCVCGQETRIGWGTCVHCWDWIWPGERVYSDAQGRTPVCVVCHVRAKETT